MIHLKEPTLNRITRAHDLGKQDLKSSNNIHLISKIAQELNFKRELSTWYSNATSLNNYTRYKWTILNSIVFN